MGFIFVPLSNLSLVGVPEHDAGVAGATLNATQQVGGSLGAALFNTFFTTAVAAYLTDHLSPAANPREVAAEAQVHGLRSRRSRTPRTPCKTRC